MAFRPSLAAGLAFYLNAQLERNVIGFVKGLKGLCYKIGQMVMIPINIKDRPAGCYPSGSESYGL